MHPYLVVTLTVLPRPQLPLLPPSMQPPARSAPRGVWGAPKRASFTHLNELDRQGNPCRSLFILPNLVFGDAEALQLAAALRTNTSLEELSASGHALSADGMRALMTACARQPGQSLRLLCIGDAQLGADEGGGDKDGVITGALRELAEGLPSLRSLRQLDLERKGMGTAAAGAVAAAVGAHGSLWELKLGHNQLGGSGVRALCAPAPTTGERRQQERGGQGGLPCVAGLRHLGLADNGIDGREVSVGCGLGAVLRAGQLESLDLADNPWGGEDAESLIRRGKAHFESGAFGKSVKLCALAAAATGDPSTRLTAFSHCAEAHLCMRQPGQVSIFRAPLSHLLCDEGWGASVCAFHHALMPAGMSETDHRCLASTAVAGGGVCGASSAGQPSTRAVAPPARAHPEAGARSAPGAMALAPLRRQDIWTHRSGGTLPLERRGRQRRALRCGLAADLRPEVG